MIYVDLSNLESDPEETHDGILNGLEARGITEEIQFSLPNGDLVMYSDADYQESSLYITASARRQR